MINLLQSYVIYHFNDYLVIFLFQFSYLAPINIYIYFVTQLNMVKIKENYKSINNIFVTSYIEVSLLTY